MQIYYADCRVQKDYHHLVLLPHQLVTVKQFCTQAAKSDHTSVHNPRQVIKVIVKTNNFYSKIEVLKKQII